jgi:c(7)-type cytochrome triheme protein
MCTPPGYLEQGLYPIKAINYPTNIIYRHFEVAMKPVFNFSWINISLRLTLPCLIIILAMSGSTHAEVKTFQIDGDTVPVNKDGIHDPENDAIEILQQPVEAMAEFPRDKKGNVDWVKTLEKGLIEPRADMYGEEKLTPKVLDIVLKETSGMPNVLFPHRQHTQWLTCKNCHPAIFKEKQGANDITMETILTGKACGVCHGKVSFPPTKNCYRCHSVTK